MARTRFRNGRRFRLDLDRFEALTLEQMSELLRKIAFQLLTLIVEKTPVDTGRARANWQVAVDTDAGTAEVSGTGTFDVETAGLVALAGVGPFSRIILFNNVQYIVFLEEGSSRQAPRGMVQLSIAEVESQFR